MHLEIHIDVSDTSGISCSAKVDGLSAYDVTEANVLAIGALEIAKSSLLARRWGINTGNFDANEPLVKQPDGKPKRSKKK